MSIEWAAIILAIFDFILSPVWDRVVDFIWFVYVIPRLGKLTDKMNEPSDEP